MCPELQNVSLEATSADILVRPIPAKGAVWRHWSPILLIPLRRDHKQQSKINAHHSRKALIMNHAEQASRLTDHHALAKIIARSSVHS